MWKFFYDTFLQFLTSPWAEYMNKYKAQGRLVRDIFFNDVYRYSGLILTSISIISILLYYFYFNKRFGSYYRKRTWFMWILTTSFLVGVITFFGGRTYLTSFLSPTTYLVAWLSLINSIYCLLGSILILTPICQLLAILSRRMLNIDISPMASRTPL